jgi:hypothetical protein
MKTSFNRHEVSPMHNRALTALVAALAGLALAAAPALAGEDDDGDDDDSPAQVQNLPAPAAGGAPAGAPRGGVATGLGGTADDGDDGMALLGLASGVLLLTATGGVVATRRRSS